MDSEREVTSVENDGESDSQEVSDERRSEHVGDEFADMSTAHAAIVECDDLETLEKIIRNESANMFTSSFKVGAALNTIRTKKLYKPNFKTFESYCRKVWDISRSEGNLLSNVFEVRTILSPIGDKILNLITHKTQLRPLIPLKEKKEDLLRVFNEAIRDLNGEPLTERKIQNAYDHYNTTTQTFSDCSIQKTKKTRSNKHKWNFKRDTVKCTKKGLQIESNDPAVIEIFGQIVEMVNMNDGGSFEIIFTPDVATEKSEPTAAQ